jgi:hypothetical protein
MTFKTHNDKQIDLNGTHLQGYVITTFAKLIEIFGEPMEGDGYKVDAEWGIEFDDGSVATIYNYKDGKNYCGDEGLDVKDISDWHIGGLDKSVVEKIKSFV